KIEAGQPATNLVLFCTNRIGQADNYYAADQAWKKNCLEIFAARAADTNLNPSGERTIFTAPVENWVLQTNRNQGEFSVTKVSVFRTDREDVAGSLLMTLRGSRGDEALMLNAELWDDHACGFRGENLSEGNKFTVRFPNYPRNENTFFFNIGKESDDGQVIIPYSSFTLTNLFKQTPDQFKVEPFPTKRELDLVTVSLAKFEGGYPEFEFSKNGRPNTNWHEG